LDVIAAAYAKKPKWHPSQELTPMADGRTELKVRVDNLVEIEKDLLRWGEHAEVLSPPELRTRMWQIYRAAPLLYEAKEAPMP
jgi:predicted DNA-binding transcriptional regulator YafY